MILPASVSKLGSAGFEENFPEDCALAEKERKIIHLKTMEAKMRKKLFLMLLTIAFISSPAFGSDLKGFKTPQEAINAFLGPLKKGKDGVRDSMAASGKLNGEIDETSDVAQTFKEDMKEQGKVVRYKEVDSYKRLNGDMQKYTYEIHYSSGKKREVEFTLIRPSAGGDFYIMRVRPQ